MENLEPQTSSRRMWKLGLLSLLWIMAVAFGIYRLTCYSLIPGTAAVAPAQWPDASLIKRREDGVTLVMAVHPFCPCSRASIAELAEIMRQSRGKVSAYLLFYKPKGYPQGWEKHELWQSAAEIPGINLIVDEDGLEAQRFDTSTSGQCLLYDKVGQLRFAGGITSTRGHSGDNAGREAIISLVTRSNTDQQETPVFGCPIANSDKPSAKGVACKSQ